MDESDRVEHHWFDGGNKKGCLEFIIHLLGLIRRGMNHMGIICGEVKGSIRFVFDIVSVKSRSLFGD